MPSSDGSVPNSPVESLQISDSNKLHSLSSQESTTDNDTCDGGAITDRILKRSLSVQVPSSESNIRKKLLNTDGNNNIELKQFDLGRHYDPMISTSMDTLNNLNKEAEKSPTNMVVESTSRLEEISKLRKFIKKDVDPHYIDLITSETISRKYKDWHFITEDTTFQERSLYTWDQNRTSIEGTDIPCTLEQLVRSFGVQDSTISALSGSEKLISTSRTYDNLCEISPPCILMDALLKYCDNSVFFIKTFICFILDRKVYDSIDCDSLWCSNTMKTISENSFFECYSQLVKGTDYFMHYRLVRSIPSIKSPLIKHITGEDTGKPVAEKLIIEFNRLLDNKYFEDLLYFTLFVLGSEYIPFGKNKHTLYFEHCVSDYLELMNSQVELRLLKGILNIFIKI